MRLFSNSTGSGKKSDMLGNSLNKHILFAFSVVFLIVVLTVAIVFYSIINRSMLEKSRTQIEHTTALTAHQIGYIFDSVNRISVRTLFSHDIISALAGAKEYTGKENYFKYNIDSRNAIDDALPSIAGLEITDYIINFYTGNGFYSTKNYSISWEKVCAESDSGHLKEIDQKLDDQTIYVSAINSLYWTENEYTTPCISISRRFTYYVTQKSLGIVEILIPYHKFESSLGPANAAGYTVLCNDTDAVWINEQDGFNLPNTGTDLCRLSSESLSFFNLDHQTQQMYYSLPISKYGVNVLSVQLYDESTQLTNFLLIIGSGIILYFVSLITYFMIIRRMTRPLSELMSSLRSVSWDTLGVDINPSYSSKGDLYTLQRTYVAILGKLNESVTLLLDSRLNEQKAVFLALQSQISPHFIYNIITNISSCAYENGVYKIVDICEQLSSLLRYASDYSTDISTLEHEMTYTESYLQLMKIRFESKLLYNLSYDNTCANLHIPRLIIQTVIENCFNHAFSEAVSPWYISVNAYRNDNEWIIDIRHNGIPIESERMNEILENSKLLYDNIAHGFDKLRPNGLGLLNAITRLRMFCNNEIRFEVFPDPENSDFCITRFGGRIICLEESA